MVKRTPVRIDANGITHTMQEDFDKVLERLTDGRGPARMSDTNACLYRDHTGLPCAIGCLIPDELYNPLMDTVIQGVVDNTLVKEVLGLSLKNCDEDYLYFLQALQEVHDYHLHPQFGLSPEGISCIKALAEQHGLVITKAL